MNNATKNLSRNLTYSDIRTDINESKDLHEDIFNHIEKARANLIEDTYTHVEARGLLPSYTYKEFIIKKENIDYLVNCDSDLETAFLKIKPIYFDKVLKN